MKGDLTEITGFLEGLDKPVLSEERKLQMKNRIMAHVRTTEQGTTGQVSQEGWVINYVRRVAGAVVLTPYQKVSMKERILSYISTAKQSKFAFTGAFDLGKRLVGAFLIVAMVMGIFNFAGGSINVASADSFTVIESLRGEVVVERGDDKYLAYDEMELREGDKVYTGEDGWVSIKFFDDSVVRLKKESVVKIDKLFEDPENNAVTSVEVEVNYGDMWTKVLSLFEEGSSFAVKAGDVRAVAKKASFNVHKDDNESVIEVYSNVVEMQANKEEVKVKSGQKASAQNDGSKVVVASSDSSDNDWVQSNLESDKAHIAKVEEKKNEELRGAVGSLPQSAFYPLKSLKTGVVRFLTFDDIDKQKIDLEAAERKFVEWSVMMKDGEVEQSKAEIVFDEFVAEVEKFKSVVVNVRGNGDKEYADELKAYLKSKVGEAKTFMKAVSPASALYPAKEYLYAAEQASAENDTEKAIIMKKQAAVKLVEVQDLNEVGEKELAKEAFDDYAKVSEKADEGMEALSKEQANEAESALVQVSKDESDLITTIEESEAIDAAIDAAVAAEAGKVAEEKVAPVLPVPIITPVQQTADYGVPTAGTGNNVKLLDPLLNLTR